MSRINTFMLAGFSLLIGACSSTETCDEPQFYESAQGGRRIEVPDGLSDLQAYKELKIPEASPGPPREAGGNGCIDRPPTLRIDEPEDQDEDENQ